MRSTAARRLQILMVLSHRRYETIDNLVFEFGVCRRTIQNDIDSLSISSPIYTVRGHGGGIYVMDGWYYGKNCLTVEQEHCLLSLSQRVTQDEQRIIQSSLQSFSRAKRKTV